MYGYIVFGFSCLCTCVHAEKCVQAVYAKRETFHLPLGGNLLLACVVQHCGENDWAGSWTWLPIRGNMSTVVSTLRHTLTNEILSANQSCLRLQIQGFKQADEGEYGCKVIWESGTSDQGHVSSVKERSLLVLVGVPASLYALFALLLLAHCVSSGLKRHQTPGGPLDTSQRDKVPSPVPPPLPRGPVPKKKKSWIREAYLKPKVQRQPSTELVYVEVVHYASGDHEQAVRESSLEDTVYSSIMPVGGACDAYGSA